jgi:hypothetical protein
MKRILLTCWLVGVAHTLLSQASIIPLQQNPALLRWRQVRTPQFRVIYPAGFEAEAQRTARALQAVLVPPKLGFMPPVAQSLGKSPRRIDVVLQNQTTISNGFVTLGPRRSEFFSMTPQDYNFLGTNDWLELLTVHEMRHVVQFDKSRIGINKLAYWVFGNNMLMALAGVAAPNWFWEGDAVGIETALTPSGRGRIPNFDLVYRTQLLERGGFGYHKAMLGSFRDFVPNHYVLGYHLTTYLKRQHGAGIFGPVAEDAWASSVVPFTFSNALKKHTGRYVRRAYRDMNRELDSLWRGQLADLPLTNANLITQRQSKTFTEYEFPQYLSDGSVLALRTGLGHIPQFVRVDRGGQAKVVFTPGFMPSTGQLSVANDQVVWVEFNYDRRWQMRNYQVIKIYDLKTKRLRTLTRKSRYVAAAFSPDSRQVATIEAGPDNQYALCLLDAATGQEVRRFPNPLGDFLAMPRFSADGQSLVYLRVRRGAGKTLAQTNLTTGEQIDLLPFSHENIGHPVPHGHYVFYNSPYMGIDNIYALDLRTGKRWQVTSRKFGAYNPCPSADGKRLVFNDFQQYGMEVAEMALLPELWVPLERVADRSIRYYEPLVAQEANANVLRLGPDTTFATKKYPKAAGLFNIYSWSPLVDPNDPTALQLAVYAQNLLSTASTTLGLDYNAAERTSSYFGAVSYQGFYPMLDASVRTGERSASETVNSQVNTFRWRETSANFSVSVPFILTNSRFIRSAGLAAGFSYRRVGDYEGSQLARLSGDLYAVSYRATYAATLRRNARDLVGKYGVVGRLQLAHTPLGGDFTSQLLAAEGQVYLPGLLRHHSLGLRGSFQREASQNYRFTSPIVFPRGYRYTGHFQLWNAAVEYRAPLLYPDLSLGPLVNLQRVKTMLFADFGLGTNPGRPTTFYRTLGVDLTFDLNLMRLPTLLFDLGVRFLYFPQSNTSGVELVIGRIGF